MRSNRRAIWLSALLVAAATLAPLPPAQAAPQAVSVDWHGGGHGRHGGDYERGDRREGHRGDGYHRGAYGGGGGRFEHRRYVRRRAIWWGRGQWWGYRPVTPWWGLGHPPIWWGTLAIVPGRLVRLGGFYYPFYLYDGYLYPDYSRPYVYQDDAYEAYSDAFPLPPSYGTPLLRRGAVVVVVRAGALID